MDAPSRAQLACSVGRPGQDLKGGERMRLQAAESPRKQAGSRNPLVIPPSTHQGHNLILTWDL